MIGSFFNTVVYEPLYNGLIFLIDIIPGHDVGLAVILLTLLVRLILYPSSRNAIRAQMRMQELQPQIEAINEKYKDNREEKARQTLALYREKKLNPLAPIFPLLLQLPIIFTLYFIFSGSGLPEIRADKLYSFISYPLTVDTNFLHLFDVTEKNMLLALFTGITQFAQAFVYKKLTQSKMKPSQKPSFQADFQKSMNFQMQYVFPIFVAVISYQFTAVIGLYWTTSNLFSIMQELITRRPNGGHKALIQELFGKKS